MSKALSDFLNYFNQEQSRYPWQLTTESAEAIAPRVKAELSQEEEADLQERSNRFLMNLDTLLGEAKENVAKQTMDTLLSRLEQWLPRQQCLDVVKICQAEACQAMGCRSLTQHAQERFLQNSNVRVLLWPSRP